MRSIVAMVVAVGFFSLMDAVLKTLGSTYPAMQVAALRGVTALPLVCVYVFWRGEARTLLQVRWSLHLLRGVFSVGMLSLFTYALSELPLTDAYAVFFVAPLLITMLSIPVLKEKVLPLHWVAIAVGFAGVLIAMRPDGAAFFSLGAMAVLAAACMYAMSAVAARVLSRTDSSVQVVFWTTAMLTIGAGALALPMWVAIRPEHWLLLAALGGTGFLGGVAITEAFQTGKASAVAPFEYTALAWGMGLDWAIWRTLPDHYTLVGAAIIVASGVYLIRHERAQEPVIAP
ncbi:DMT family transporter [Rhodoferax aquaticus]|uniref:DMT family transporter n=2 Tax=Rhodoferax aquaticus TaxID=2527691 RepID=A0A515EW15_9BURK|nr:DMT family transporter [Rhodoferax aquaticus]